jgi:hypothetical protein
MRSISSHTELVDSSSGPLCEAPQSRGRFQLRAYERRRIAACSSADRASRGTVARARSAENLSIDHRSLGGCCRKSRSYEHRSAVPARIGRVVPCRVTAEEISPQEVSTESRWQPPHTDRSLRPGAGTDIPFPFVRARRPRPTFVDRTTC